MLPVESPFKTYTGTDGKPLDGGYVYFGQPSQNPITSPVTVYWDAAGTQPAAQPLRTVNGYIVRAGTPANVFFTGSYSELVQDSKKRQVFYARTSDDFSISTVVSNFLTSLASSTGSSLIGYIQAAVGAVAWTVLGKLRERFTIHDFMTDAERTDVAGSGALDVTAAVQKALTARVGKTLRILPGTYRLKTATGGSLLTLAGNIEIIADKGAIFLIDSTVANTIDVITVNPTTLADDGLHIKGLSILPESGSPARHVLKVNLDATHGLKKLHIEDCLLRSKNGKAVYVDNPAGANVNGLFLSKIERNELDGGLLLPFLGDSNSICDNVITGPGIGIEFTMLSETASAGASAKLEIHRNNITSQGGAILGSHARSVSILDNNIEQTVLLDNGYCINLSYMDKPLAGADYQMLGATEIANNKIEPADPTSRCNGLYLNNCNGTVVRSNSIGTSARPSSFTFAVTLQVCNKVKVERNAFYLSAGCGGLNIDASTKNTLYVPGIVSPFNTSFTEVNDLGIGTKGVWKTLSYNSGWSRVSTNSPDLAYYKTADNMVVMRGEFQKSTAIVANDFFSTLPVGARDDSTAAAGNLRMGACYVSSADGLTRAAAIRILGAASGNDGQMWIADALANAAYVSIDGLQFYSPEV
jgi:hypothetical protein